MHVLYERTLSKSTKSVQAFEAQFRSPPELLEPFLTAFIIHIFSSLEFPSSRNLDCDISAETGISCEAVRKSEALEKGREYAIVES